MIKDIKSACLKPSEVASLLSHNKTTLQQSSNDHSLKYIEPRDNIRIYLPSQENSLKYNPTTNQVLHPIMPSAMPVDQNYGVEPLLRSIKNDQSAGNRRYLIPFSELKDGFSIGHFRTLIVDRKEQGGQYKFDFQIVDSKSNWMFDQLTVLGSLGKLAAKVFGIKYPNSDVAFADMINKVFTPITEDDEDLVLIQPPTAIMHETKYLGIQSSVKDNRCGAFTVEVINRIIDYPVAKPISEILGEIEPSDLLTQSQLKDMQRKLSGATATSSATFDPPAWDGSDDDLSADPKSEADVNRESHSSRSRSL
jgi:hypothetical protein